MQQPELIPHLFRTEYRKIVSVLCRHFGLAQLETAEDIASETFLSAAQTWPMKGIPENPVAWLYTVAKNKTKNQLQRNALFEQKLVPGIKIEKPENAEIDLSEQNISDSQLQMMFAICHPAISPEAQIGLSLRILCGFGIDEIADAFLTNKETINKRLFRAKEILRSAGMRIEMPVETELHKRLETVLTTIYLLFNEGYYSLSQNTTVRKDLCLEAMRLCYLLIENPLTNRPGVNALMALMCFHASRFEARTGENGEMILYDDQNTELWDKELVHKGAYFLNQAIGETITPYHLEASIAYWHTRKEDTPEKWENILQLYNQLLQLKYSPAAALNRTFALSKARGKETAIAEAEKLKLVNHHFYFLLLGELYSGINNKTAKEHMEKAFDMAKTKPEKELIRKKINTL